MWSRIGYFLSWTVAPALASFGRGFWPSCLRAWSIRPVRILLKLVFVCLVARFVVEPTLIKIFSNPDVAMVIIGIMILVFFIDTLLKWVNGGMKKEEKQKMGMGKKKDLVPLMGPAIIRWMIGSIRSLTRVLIVWVLK